MVTLCEEWGEARAAILKMDPSQKAFLKRFEDLMLRSGWNVTNSSNGVRTSESQIQAPDPPPMKEHSWTTYKMRPLAFEFWTKTWGDLEKKLDRWIELGFVRRGEVEEWDGKVRFE